MRLFVALDLPPAIRTALADWAEAAAPPALRRVAPGNLHLTLAFLGSRDEREAAAAGALLEAHMRPLGELHTSGALWLPPRRPRVLTVALREDAALSALQADLVTALERAIGFRPEARPFTPHVTVGRVARGARVDARSAVDPALPQLSFRPPALTLYRSQTGADGPRYEPLERVAAA